MTLANHMAATRTSTIPVDNRLDPRAARSDLLSDICVGLAREQPVLPTRMLYAGDGGRLFGDIAIDPRYRLARRERALLKRVAPLIIDRLRPEHIVELGGGVSDKLLDLLRWSGDRTSRVTAFDIDALGVVDALSGLGPRLGRGVVCDAIIGDMERHLEPIPRQGRRLVIMLGSTVGNFARVDRRRLLETVVASSQPGDALLLGVDINRRVRDQLAAYRGAAVARFNLNAIDTLAALTGADVSGSDVEHHVAWDEQRSAVLVQLIPRRRCEVSIGSMNIPVLAGVPITTARSVKFDPGGLDDDLATSGFGQTTWWLNDSSTHALVLAVRGV